MNTQTDSLSTFKKMTIAVIVSTSLAGCGADIEQANSNQINSWSRAPVAEATGENCEFGGQKIETGADTNRDGELQDSEINKVDYLCDELTTATYVNEMASLDDNFWRTFSLYMEDNTAAPDDANYRFQGDLLRIKRGENTAEYLDYVVAGAIESAVISAYYWEGDTPEVAPFKIYVSKVGANNAADWVEVTVTQEIVGDYTQRDTDEDQSDGQNDNWVQVDFTISDIVNTIGEGYDFIRVEFPVVASGQAWHPQLGNLAVTYTADAATASDNNDAPAPATDPNLEVIPTVQSDGLSNFNNAFARSANLVLDSGESQRFGGDNNRYKRSSNTAEYVQYEVYGAVQSITLNTHYTSKFDAQPFVIEVSQTGGSDAAEWTELTSVVTPVDGDVEVEGWLAFTQTAMVDAENSEFDFVRVTFPVMAKEGVDADYETWVPELGNVDIAYVENFALDANNVARDLSSVEIAGGQAPLAIDSTVIDTMTANSATTLFSHYVTRGEGSNGIGDSNKLYDDESGEEFRFVSYNIPNLVLTEDPIWDITPVFEQEDGIKTIADMGGKITRIYTMGIFDASNPEKVKHISWDVDGNFVFNEDIFVAMDNLLAIANKHGVRVQIPFIDRSLWWGGIAHFADHYGKTSPEFFTDSATIEGFKEVISYVLNRVNTVTGVAYKDDPAVFAWETGNELRSDDTAAIEAWTAEIAAYIKSIDSKHLVMDGREARSTQASGEVEMRMSNAALFDQNIDIVSNHYYGEDFSARIEQDLTTISGAKPFIVGEIGFGDIEMESAINTVVNEGATGILLWSLRTLDVKGGFKDHDDGSAHAYHWPGFADNYVYNESKIIANAWEMSYTIDGVARPDIPAPAKAPVMLTSPSNLDIRWQGVTSAQYYDIERSDNGTDGWTLVGDDIEIGNTRATNYTLADRTDSFGDVHTNVKYQILFQDASTVEGETYYYRAKAINASGESAWSNVIGTAAALVENGVVLDNLSTLTSTTALSDSGNLFVDSGNTEFFEDADSGRIKHGGYTEEWLMYSFGGDVNSFMVKTYFWRGNLQTDVADFKVQLSTDGITWDDFASESFDIAQRGDWQQIDLAGREIASGYKHLRVVFPVTGDDYSSWAQQLGSVKIGVGSQVIDDLHDKQIDGGFIVDDFNSYPDDASIKATWVDQAWTTISLDNSAASQQMQVQYDVGSDGYAGVVRTFGGAQDWSAGNALRFHLTHQNAGNILVIQLEEASVQLNPNGKADNWEWALILDDTNMDTDITIKFSDFLYNHNFGASDFHADTVLDQNNILKMGIWQNESFNPYGNDTPVLIPANNNTGENLLFDDISIVTVN